MIRFFVSPSDVSGGLIRLSPGDAAHIKSLRLRPGELFVACDGEGVDYMCRLAGRDGERDGVRSVGFGDGLSGAQGGARDGGSLAEIVETQPSRGEP